MNPLDRVSRERRFHDEQARRGSSSRSLLDRFVGSFYDKEIVWRSVWREVPDLSERVVMDYGCGVGDFSIELAKRGAQVYGIDISQENIALARRMSPSGIRVPEFSVQDAHRTTFPDNSFDLVFGNGILHHLDLQLAYAEVARVLRPGGKAYFMEPLSGHPLVSLVRRATLNARSPDEAPLSFNDIMLAARFFKSVYHDEFFLLCVGVAPLHLVSLKLAKRLITMLHRVDQVMFRSIPQFRRMAWITLIQLEK